MELLAKLSKGEKSAFDCLYKDYFKLVFGIAMSVLKNKDDSADVTQNVFVKLYTMPKEKFPTASPLSWLYTVSKNESLHFLRDRKKLFPLEEKALLLPDDKNEIEDLIDLDAYDSMIRSLSPERQEIITLKVIGGLTCREIADLLHIPIGTVQWKYHDSLHRLKSIMGGLFFLFSGAALWNWKEYFSGPTAGVPESEVLAVSPVPVGIFWSCLALLSGVIFLLMLKKSFKKPTK